MARLQSTTTEQVDAVDIDRIDVSTIVRQHGSQGSSHNFTSIDDGNHLVFQFATDGFAAVVASRTGLEQFDDTQGGAGQQTLLIVGGIIQVANVAVQVGSVSVTQTFHIAFVTDGISQIIILRRPRKGFFLSKDGIVDNDTVHARIVVGVNQSSFNINGIVQSS